MQPEDNVLSNIAIFVFVLPLIRLIRGIENLDRIHARARKDPLNFLKAVRAHYLPVDSITVYVDRVAFLRTGLAKAFE